MMRHHTKIEVDGFYEPQHWAHSFGIHISPRPGAKWPRDPENEYLHLIEACISHVQGDAACDAVKNEQAGAALVLRTHAPLSDTSVLDRLGAHEAWQTTPFEVPASTSTSGCRPFAHRHGGQFFRVAFLENVASADGSIRWTRPNLGQGAALSFVPPPWVSVQEPWETVLMARPPPDSALISGEDSYEFRGTERRTRFALELQGELNGAARQTLVTAVIAEIAPALDDPHSYFWLRVNEGLPTVEIQSSSLLNSVALGQKVRRMLSQHPWEASVPFAVCGMGSPGLPTFESVAGEVRLLEHEAGPGLWGVTCLERAATSNVVVATRPQWAEAWFEQTPRRRARERPSYEVVLRGSSPLLAKPEIQPQRAEKTLIDPYVALEVHLEQHDSITEAEVVRMLGSSRMYRRFVRNFDQFAAGLPFALHVAVRGGLKVYLKS